jgi:hypothetical protein
MTPESIKAKLRLVDRPLKAWVGAWYMRGTHTDPVPARA